MSGPYWTKSWNPVTGCTPCSPGCERCWARSMARRFDGGDFTPIFSPDRLDQPLHWRKPQTVFVANMGDLFHEAFTDWQVFAAWRVMAQSPQHTFLVLTKRPDRMHEWFGKLADTGPVGVPPVMWRFDGPHEQHSFGATPEQAQAVVESGRGSMFHDMVRSWGDPPEGAARPSYDWIDGERWWPTVLFNLWLGVTVCNQEEADRNIPLLLDTPAAHRWVSVEPMLGPVDLHLDEVVGHVGDTTYRNGNYISWVVLGGESGPGARPMQPEWALDVWRQCKAAGVPFYFKQWGTNQQHASHRALPECFEMQAANDLPWGVTP